MTVVGFGAVQLGFRGSLNRLLGTRVFSKSLEAYCVDVGEVFSAKRWISV